MNWLEVDPHFFAQPSAGRRLEAFTGIRWMVMVAKDGGDKPIARQRQESRDSLFLTAREHPDIQAVLRVCNVHSVPIATNVAAADLFLASPLLHEGRRVVTPRQLSTEPREG